MNELDQSRVWGNQISAEAAGDRVWMWRHEHMDPNWTVSTVQAGGGHCGLGYILLVPFTP